MNQKYSVSFTAASLEVQEMRQCSMAYIKNGCSWSNLSSETIQNDILTKNNPKTATRKFAEIKKRLLNLKDIQIEEIAKGTVEDATVLCFLSVIKTYALFRDYCCEVLAPKINSFDRRLTTYELDQFIEAKALTVPEVANISTTTKAKIKQVMTKFLSQAGVLDSGLLYPNKISYIVKALINNESKEVLTALLLETADINNMLGPKI